MGVFYENTGLENPMFRNRYAHLLVIEIVVFAPVSAPRLSTLTVLHLKVEAYKLRLMRAAMAIPEGVIKTAVAKMKSKARA